jgi:type IV pilus assembly protein PilN
VDKQIEQINSFEEQKRQNLARMQIIEKLQQSRSEIVHVFDTFTKVMPDGVYLTALAQTEQSFKLTGLAQTSARVSALMEAIDSSEWLKEAEIEDVTLKTVGQEFIMHAKQRVSAVDETATANAATATGNRTAP